MIDTVEGLPAAIAGIGPGMKLIAVNGRRYSPEVLRDALKAGRTDAAPLNFWSRAPSITRPTNSTITAASVTRIWCATSRNRTC